LAFRRSDSFLLAWAVVVASDTAEGAPQDPYAFPLRAEASTAATPVAEIGSGTEVLVLGCAGELCRVRAFLAPPLTGCAQKSDLSSNLYARGMAALNGGAAAVAIGELRQAAKVATGRRSQEIEFWWGYAEYSIGQQLSKPEGAAPVDLARAVNHYLDAEEHLRAAGDVRDDAGDVLDAVGRALASVRARLAVTPGPTGRFTVLSPVAGHLEVTTKAPGPSACEEASAWCFSQWGVDRPDSTHGPGGGIGNADDTYAWDVNRYPSADERGQPVYSAAGGVVASAFAGQCNADGANVCSSGQVLVEHSAAGLLWWSGYLHLADIQVAPGDSVQPETVLGYLSNVSDRPIDDHLHFVVYTVVNRADSLRSFDVAIRARPVGAETQEVGSVCLPPIRGCTVSTRARVGDRKRASEILGKHYPKGLQHRIGGTVHVRVRVDADGRVQQAEVTVSSGQPLLDSAALRAVREFEFIPARCDDRTIPVWLSFPVTFDVSPDTIAPP
jgi:TonB family protein